MTILKNIKRYFPSLKDRPTSWASEGEIKEAGFSEATKDANGILFGIHPYTHKPMLHNGTENVLVLGPTRSGKSVNTVIPTAIQWKESAFFYDYKGELWASTAGYREKELHQEVVRFCPTCINESTVKWNPLMEIRLHTANEWFDAYRIAQILTSPEDANGWQDNFFQNAASDVLAATALYLLYRHEIEGGSFPTLADVCDILNVDLEAFDRAVPPMMLYPCISEATFCEARTNPLQKIYGQYLADYMPFRKALGRDDIRSLEDILEAVREKWAQGELVDFQSAPFSSLLAHPKIHAAFSFYQKGQRATRESILTLARSAVFTFTDSNVRKNTETSDFNVADLVDSKKKTSFYLTMGVSDICVAKPVARLLVAMLLDAVSAHADGQGTNGKTRLLVLLDEFPQILRLDNIPSALTFCQEQGTRICLVVQSIQQLEKAYGTKAMEEILSHTPLQIFFKPNTDGGEPTATYIARRLQGTGYARDDVEKMASEQVLLVTEGHLPILAGKFRYYLDRAYQQATNLEGNMSTTHRLTSDDV